MTSVLRRVDQRSPSHFPHHNRNTHRKCRNDKHWGMSVPGIAILVKVANMPPAGHDFKRNNNPEKVAHQTCDNPRRSKYKKHEERHDKGESHPAVMAKISATGQRAHIYKRTG
ncbi:hypothetical protein N7501_006074 [Penicillium viridicatum]|nr:hypothetical protein N7501_006074 [Penicillium viridicatum]